MLQNKGKREEKKVSPKDIEKMEADEMEKAIKESLELENERKTLEEKEKTMLDVFFGI